MANRTFNMVRTQENQIGLAIVDSGTVSGLLLIAFLQNKEAIVYSTADQIYVYSVVDASESLTVEEQLDAIERCKRSDETITILARGTVEINRLPNATHITVGGKLLTSIYFDDSATLITVEQSTGARQKSYGVDFYDPVILSLIDTLGRSVLRSIVLAINDLIISNEHTRPIPARVH